MERNCFEGSSGAVYGKQALITDFNVESGNTLTISSDAKLTVPQGVSFANSGTLDLTGGTMECSGSLTNNGTLNVESGSKLNVSETLMSSGTTVIEGEAQCFSIQNSGAMTISGKFTCNGGTNTGLIYNNGTFTNTGTISGENGYVVSATQVDGVGEQLITSEKMFYLNEDGEKTYLTADDAIYPLTAADHTWKKQFGKNTWYLAIKDLTIDDGVKLEDDVNLILMDGVTLTINGKNDNGGINAENHTLNICAQSYGDGMGTLKATGGNYNWMAIGGSNANINIKGGFIEAGLTGENYSGIGSGMYRTFGKLTITGGIVKTKSIGTSKVGDATGGLTAPAGSSAVIYTQQTEVNSSKVSGFNGIIFLQEKGSVYGNAKLASDLTVEENETLTIPSGTTLTVSSGTTLTINGKLVIEGTLVVEGTLVNNATLIKGNGSGSVTMDDWTYGDTAKTPTAASNTNGTKNVTYKYKVKGATEYLTEVPTNAGEYTVEATFAGTDYYNEYTATAAFTINQKTLTIDHLAIAKRYYDGTNKASYVATPVLVGLVGDDEVTLEGGVPTFTSIFVGQNIPISFTGFTLDGADKGNYTLIQPTGITADISAYNAFGSEYATTTMDWTNQDFVVTANEGWQVSETNTADGTWSNSLTRSAETGDDGDSITFYVKNASHGYISEAITKNYRIDKTAPDGKICIGERNAWETFVNTISFGLFFKDKQEVVLDGKDQISGLAKIEYLVSADDLNIEQLKNKTFAEYSNVFSVEPDDKLIIYERVNDLAGNVAYLRSDGIVLDGTAPVISGANDGKTYCAAVTLTITDKYLDTVTLNGEPVTLTEDKLTLEPADGKQTVVATDKAGNSTTIAVTVNDGHTWGSWVSNGDGTHSRSCKFDAEHMQTADCFGGTATCKDRAVCDDCKTEYGAIDLNNHSNLQFIDAKAATIIADGNNKYWYCDGCGRYFSDKNGKNEISKADTVVKKLPIVIKGDNAQLTQGTEEPLSFTSDAEFTDFIGVEIDGKVLDSKHYNVVSGSTVVTLNANYVATLSAGEHTLGIVSQNGTATAKFTINKKAAETIEVMDKADINDSTKAPQTGDNANFALWIVLLFISAGGVITSTVVCRKKSYNR